MIMICFGSLWVVIRCSLVKEKTPHDDSLIPRTCPHFSSYNVCYATQSGEDNREGGRGGREEQKGGWGFRNKAIFWYACGLLSSLHQPTQKVKSMTSLDYNTMSGLKCNILYSFTDINEVMIKQFPNHRQAAVFSYGGVVYQSASPVDLLKI